MVERDFTPEQLASEEWRPAPRYEGIYQVSSLGRVRRILVARCGPRPRAFRKQSINGHGYPAVQLTKNGRRTFCRVHPMIALAFLGPRPAGKQVNHKDGDKTNNAVENLEYVTPPENIHHADGLNLRRPNLLRSLAEHPERVLRGEDSASSKLTAAQVLEIRSRYVFGKVGAPQLARAYGMSTKAVQFLITRKTWKHI